MLLFKEQIDKREEKEKQHLQEAVEQLIGESGLHSRQAGRAFSQGQAIQCILETLGVPGPIELDEEETFFSLEEQIGQKLAPLGIMHRMPGMALSRSTICLRRAS